MGRLCMHHLGMGSSSLPCMGTATTGKHSKEQGTVYDRCPLSQLACTSKGTGQGTSLLMGCPVHPRHHR